MNIVVSGKKDFTLRLFAEKLVNVTKHPNVAAEASFYRLERDVPYIAETLQTSLQSRDLDLDIPDYWILTTELIEAMNPVRAQSIADKILLSLAIMGRFPSGYYEWSGINLGQKMYGVASRIHPEESLRPALSSMSFDLPVWVRALPHFSREISLSI